MDNQALIDAFTAFLELQKPVEAPEPEVDEIDVDETPIEPAEETPVDDEPVEPTDEDTTDEEPEPAKDTTRDDEDQIDVDEEVDTESEVKPQPEIKKENNKRSKENTQMSTIISEPQESLEVRSIKQFLKGEKRDNSAFTTKDGGALLTQQVLDTYAQPSNPNQLASLVNVTRVTSSAGKLPVLNRATAILVDEEEEGADANAIAKASILPVLFNCKTFKGMLPVSYEMAHDNENILSVLAQYVADITANTSQAKIGMVLQGATPVQATSIDDLKSAVNVGLTRYTDKQFVVTESFYNAVDQIKDGEGRYILSESISAPSGHTLLGLPVVIVEDEILGNAGDAKAFIGSLKSFVLMALRDQVQINWTQNSSFDQVLSVLLRADYVQADAQAGKFITFKPATQSAGK